MVKVRESAFVLLQGADALSEYQFHTRTAHHYFCSICGIYPVHRKRVTPNFCGIDVGCLKDFDPIGIPIRMAIGACMS